MQIWYWSKIIEKNKNNIQTNLTSNTWSTHITQQEITRSQLTWLPRSLEPRLAWGPRVFHWGFKKFDKLSPCCWDSRKKCSKKPIHPGKRTFWSPKWKFGSNDFPFHFGVTFKFWWFTKTEMIYLGTTINTSSSHPPTVEVAVLTPEQPWSEFWRKFLGGKKARR